MFIWTRRTCMAGGLHHLALGVLGGLLCLVLWLNPLRISAQSEVQPEPTGTPVVRHMVYLVPMGNVPVTGAMGVRDYFSEMAGVELAVLSPVSMPPEALDR